MRRWLIVVVTVGLLALSFAALDDITTSSAERDFYAEYAVVAVTAAWCMVLVVTGPRRRT